MDLWLRVFHQNRLLKDWRDSMNNMKSENNNTKSTRKVKNFSDFNVKLIQLLKRPNSNSLTWKSSTTCILKLSRKSTHSSKCYGLKYQTKRSTQWNKVPKSMVNNALSYQRILKNGRLIRSSKLQSKTWNNFCQSLAFWKRIQSKIDIGKLWILRLLIEFHLINLKYLSLKTWQKLRFWSCWKTLKKSVNLLKNKRKLKLLWLKSTSSGNRENSISHHGVREKTPFLLVFAFKKLQKDLKKIKWLSVQSMPKDTLFHSKRELSNWSDDSQILHKLLTCGSRSKSFGQV